MNNVVAMNASINNTTISKKKGKKSKAVPNLFEFTNEKLYKQIIEQKKSSKDINEGVKILTSTKQKKHSDNVL